ncbi:MAG: hypothetical protein KGS72_13735 [Cyanobacteria bacterium REEB67]|nr:hypothetical protein [Cyanobacteria bacterium REEB67]
MTNRHNQPGSSTSSRDRACAALALAGTLTLQGQAAMAEAPAAWGAGAHPLQMTSTTSQAAMTANWQNHAGIIQNAQQILQHSQAQMPRLLNPLVTNTTFATNRHKQLSAITSTFQTQANRKFHVFGQTAASNDLNLTSARLNLLGGNIANFKEITIQVGGTSQVVSLTSRLTAAEVVAAEQVLTSGSQTIQLNSHGTASGGTITLDKSLLVALNDVVGGSIGSLTIAHGVKVIDTLSTLSLSGNLTNYGSLLTASAATGNSDTIAADSIVNARGAAIGSYSGNGSGNSGLYAADPTLVATTALTNAGTTSSAGSLSISAPLVINGAANNTASNTATTGTYGPSINAAKDLNISTQNLTNNAAITSLNGNINVASHTVQGLSITGAGTFKAAQGNINLSTASGNLSLAGGNYQSKELNLNTTGDLSANFGQASGVVNTSGQNVHINADSDVLTLGTICASGDPLITNPGAINLTSSITPTKGADLTIIAGGDITSSGNITFDTSSTTGNGGNLTLVAGANFGPSGAYTHVSGGSVSGGSINLATNTAGSVVSLINTSSTVGSAGYVQLVAFAGSKAGSGTITIQNDAAATKSFIAINATTSATSPTATNGNISIMDGAVTGTAISTAGKILGHTVNISNTSPSDNGALYDAAGVGVNGINSFFAGSTTNKSNIDLNSFIQATGDITITSGAAFTNEGSQMIAIGSGTSGNSLDGVIGHNITIHAGGDILVGNLLAYGGGGAGSGALTSGQTGGTGGNGGTITLQSQNGSITGVGVINVSGGGGGGGAGGSETTNATAGGAGGKAGNVVLSAQNGDVNLYLQVLAFDGGAGGAGGGVAGGVGGGGGGGSAVGGGGGGGGGGFGNNGADFAAGGGGGIGGVTYNGTQLVAAGAGGGGGGSYGNGSKSGGAGGGSFLEVGIGGSGNVNGFNGSFNSDKAPSVPGAGAGSITPQVSGGGAATDLTSGGKGGASTNVSGTGAAGGGITMVSGDGVLDITVGGTASGKPGDATVPISTEVATLRIASSGTTSGASSVNISNTSGFALTLNQANMGSKGSLTLTTSNNLDVSQGTVGSVTLNGAASGATLNIDTSAASGASTITISGSLFTTNSTLTAGSNGGIATVVSGNISGTSLVLKAGQVINIASGVSNLTVLSSASASILQNTNDLNILGMASSGDINVLSPLQINDTGAITSSSGNITLRTTGNTTGINLGAPISAPLGAITVTANSGSNNLIVEAAASSLNAQSVVLFTSGSLGTAAAPIRTDAGTVSITTGSAASAYINDSGTGTLNFDGSASPSTGTLNLTSVAANLNIIEAPFAIVTISDNKTVGANVVLNSQSKATPIGGSGAFTVLASGNITESAGSPAITGSTITLTSNNGSIGTSGQPIAVSAPVLKLSAASTNGAIYVSAASIKSLSGTAGSAGTFSLTTSGSLDLTSSATIKSNSLIINAVGNIAIDTAISGNKALLISSAGTVTVNKTINETGTGSVVTIAGKSASGNAVTLNSTVSAETISLTGTGAVAGVAINAKIGTASTNNLSIITTGDIVGTKAAALTGATVNLTSSGGSVGSATQALNTTALNLSSNTSKNSYISQTGTVNLTASSAQNFVFSASGNLDVSGVLSSGNIQLTTAGTASGLFNDGTIGSAVSTVSLTSAAIVRNNSSGIINGASILLSAPNVENDNLIKTASGGTLTFQNSAGNLALTGSGSLQSGAQTAIALSAKGTVTVGITGGTSNPLAVITNVDSFTVNAGSTFSSPLTMISVAPQASGKGGTISINAASLAYNGAGSQSGALQLTANSSGAAGTAGGTVFVNLTGTATHGLTVGSVAGNIAISVTGQDKAGDVTLITPGALTLAPSSLNLSTAVAAIGGNAIILNGGKGVLINGDFNTAGSGTGANLTITSGSTKAFNIDGSLVGNLNGQTGITAGQGIAANSLTINNALGVINNGVIKTDSFNIVANGNVGLSTGTTGSYGSTAETNFNISSATGNVTLAGTQPTAKNVIISALKGSLSLGTGVATLGSIANNAAGGSIAIAAKTLTMSGPSLALIAAASGPGNNAGGTISLILSGTTNLKISSGAITANVSGSGSGTDGSITVATGGNLTADASALTFGSKSNSASLALSGKLLHLDNQSTLNTLSLLSESLTSNSASFSLGGAATTANGIGDANQYIVANQVVITNNGGTIVEGSALGVKGLSLTAPAVTLSGKGDIGTLATPVLVDANGSSSLRLVSTGGNAYVTTKNGNEVLSASVSKTLQLSIAGTLVGNGDVLAKALNISASDINLSAVNVNATTLSANASAGSVTINDNQTALLSVNNLAASGTVTLTTAGALTAAAAINSPGSISLSAGGTITTKAAITAAKNITLTAGGTAGAISIGAAITAGSTNTLTLTAAGKGNISEAKTGIKASAHSVVLISATGNIGASHTAPFAITADLASAVSGGTTSSIFINNSKASAQLNVSSAGKLFDYTGSLTGETINAPSVIISSPTMSGILTTNATALQAASTNGVVNVQDTQTALVKLNTISATTGGVSIVSQGALTISGLISSANGVVLTSGGNGNLVIGNNVTATTGSILLTAAGKGTISDAGSGTYKVTAPTVLLQTAGSDIGSTKAAFRTASPSLTIRSGITGNAYVANSNASLSGADRLNISTVGGLIFTDTSSSAKNTSTLNVLGVTAGAGGVSIVSNEMNLQIAPNSTIQADNGNITLQNNYVASGSNLPFLGIGSGATLQASAQNKNDYTLGNVYIALGTLPTSKTSVAGLPPANAKITISGSGQVNFGTTANPNGSISVPGPGISVNVNLYGTDRLLAFSTGKNPSTQIQIDSNVTITADPPAGAVAGPLILATPQAQSAPPLAIAANFPATRMQINAAPSPTFSLAGPRPDGSGGAPYASNTYTTNLNDNLAENLTENMTANLTDNQNGNTSGRLDGPLAQERKHLSGGLSIGARGSKVDHQTMHDGVSLLAPDCDTVVDTPHGRLSLAAGSIALLICTENQVSIYDLHDDRRGAVTFIAGSAPTGAIVLTPGRSAFLTNRPQDASPSRQGAIRREASLAEYNPALFVAYRHLTEQSVNDGKHLSMAEFEPMSMIRGLKPLQTLATSNDGKARRAMANIVKTAAILMEVGGKDNFEYFLPPQITAFAPGGDQK